MKNQPGKTDKPVSVWIILLAVIIFLILLCPSMKLSQRIFFSPPYDKSGCLDEYKSIFDPNFLPSGYIRDIWRPKSQPNTGTKRLSILLPENRAECKNGIYVNYKGQPIIVDDKPLDCDDIKPSLTELGTEASLYVFINLADEKEISLLLKGWGLNEAERKKYTPKLYRIIKSRKTKKAIIVFAAVHGAFILFKQHGSRLVPEFNSRDVVEPQKQTKQGVNVYKET